MNMKHSITRRFISLFLILLWLAGCSSSAIPAANIPEAGLPEGSFNSAGSNTNDEQLLTTPSPTLQADGSGSSPSSDTTQSGKISSDQGSSVISPSPAADIIFTTPAAPSVTPLPSPAPETTTVPESTPKAENTKSTKLVYPINSFMNDSVLCLTFDDGGNKKSVQKALDILEQYDVQCTFFVVGEYLLAHADLWKQAIEQGHQICNHTQNHKWLSELSTVEAKKEILAWEATATEVLGEDYVQRMKEEFPYLRLPGGAGTKSKRVMGILAELGYTPVGWNIESYYAVLRNYDLKNDPLEEITDSVTAHITKRASAGSIILLHFNPYDTTRLDVILDGILAKKLTMELLSEQGF